VVGPESLRLNPSEGRCCVVDGSTLIKGPGGCRSAQSLGAGGQRSRWRIANDLEGVRSLGAAEPNRGFVPPERCGYLDVGVFGAFGGCEGPQPSTSTATNEAVDKEAFKEALIAPFEIEIFRKRQTRRTPNAPPQENR
jgi:hypothetical protein